MAKKVTGDLSVIQEMSVDDLRGSLMNFLKRAQRAAHEADGKMNCSFTTTISIKKKMVGDSPVITLEVNSRERIPSPVIKRELIFEGDQLVFL